MSNNPCLTCRFAEWKRAANGRLHPSGDGRCNWQMPQTILPKSRYWIGWENNAPKPAGAKSIRSLRPARAALRESLQTAEGETP